VFELKINIQYSFFLTGNFSRKLTTQLHWGCNSCSCSCRLPWWYKNYKKESSSRLLKTSHWGTGTNTDINQNYHKSCNLQNGYLQTGNQG